MSHFIKDPAARVDYAVDWIDAAGEGQVIAASLWSVTPAEPGGIAVADHGFDLVRAAASIEGGIAGRSYRVVNRVTLTDGTSDERTLSIRVDER